MIFIIIVATIPTLVDSSTVKEFKQFNGIWNISKHNIILQINNGQTTIFDTSDSKCFKTTSSELTLTYEQQVQLATYTLQIDTNEKKLLLSQSPIQLSGTKLSSLPDLCKDLEENPLFLIDKVLLSSTENN